MTNAQVIAQREMTEVDVIAWLKAKSTEELHRFMTGPWTASILSSEEIEELYQELHEREASPLDVTAEDFVGVGRD